jgi:hypothetical protein
LSFFGAAAVAVTAPTLSEFVPSGTWFGVVTPAERSGPMYKSSAKETTDPVIEELKGKTKEIVGVSN